MDAISIGEVPITPKWHIPQIITDACDEEYHTAFYSTNALVEYAAKRRVSKPDSYLLVWPKPDGF